MYMNFYKCDNCKLAWDNEHACKCDDKCIECGKSYTVLRSIDLDFVMNDNYRFNLIVLATTLDYPADLYGDLVASIIVSKTIGNIRERAYNSYYLIDADALTSFINLLIEKESIQ